MKIIYIDVDNQQPDSFRLERPEGSRDCLFVLFKSPAIVYEAGRYVRVDQGHAILYDKGQRQSYYPAEGKIFLHDFMHFELSREEEAMFWPDIPRGQVMDVPLPHLLSEILALIRKERMKPTPCQTELLHHLGMSFLYQMKNALSYSRKAPQESTVYHRLLGLRQDVYAAPQEIWTIDRAAKQVYMSGSYLKHQYKTWFGVTFTQDVIAARLALARMLLENSTLTVQELSEKCGYGNVEHFVRQFKKETGTTPARFRRQTGGG